MTARSGFAPWLNDMSDLSRADQMALFMSPKEQRDFLSSLSNETKAALLHDWRYWARPSQLAPAGDWFGWLNIAGRGAGKTRTGAEWCRGKVETAVREGKPIRLALVAETKADARDVLVEGVSGILTISPPSFRPLYEPSKRRLTWPDGSLATLFSGDEPNQLRGPAFDGAWVDEFAKYQYPGEVWDMLEFGLRQGIHPQVLVTTTPRPIEQLLKLLKDPDVRVTRGNSFQNLRNLSPAYIKRVLNRYVGTRLGRQEVFGEVLTDTPGALWTMKLLDDTRVRLVPPLRRIVVAVDPAASSHQGDSDDEERSNETGIIACALGHDGHGYVFRDASDIYTPGQWASKAQNLFVNYGADHVVAERNNGGEMVLFTLNTVAPNVPVKLTWASRGKTRRAGPIAALYEQHRIHHVGILPALEDQMIRWTDDITDWSPDRMDALVWGLTDLFFGDQVSEADAWPTVRVG